MVWVARLITSQLAEQTFTCQTAERRTGVRRIIQPRRSQLKAIFPRHPGMTHVQTSSFPPSTSSTDRHPSRYVTVQLRTVMAWLRSQAQGEERAHVFSRTELRPAPVKEDTRSLPGRPVLEFRRMERATP